MSSVFANYAKYYDLLYQDKQYAKEATYIHKLIQQYKPETKSLFELGCGTGLHAIALAKKDYTVDGIDFSQDMLTDAAKRLQKVPKKIAERLSFTFGDVRTYTSEKTYDTVLSLFHIINYQPTNKDLKAMLATAARQTKPGGLFIFDSWYGPAVLTEKPSVRAKEFEDSETKIVRIARPDIYPNQNRVDVNYQILIINKATRTVEEINETHTMRYLFYPEVELLLDSAGFTIHTAQAWLTGQEPDFHTWGVCFVAKKTA